MKTDIEDQLRIEMVSITSLQEFASMDRLLHEKKYRWLLSDVLRKNSDFDLTMLVGPPDKQGKHPVLVSSLSDEYRRVVIPYAEDVLPEESPWLESVRADKGGKALGWRNIDYLTKLRVSETANPSHHFVLAYPVLQHSPPSSREIIIALVNFQSFQSVMDQAESLFPF